MKSKQDQLYESGILAYGNEPPDDHKRLLRAIAAMLAPSKTAVVNKPTQKISVFSGEDVLAAVRVKCRTRVQCEPYRKAWIVSLDKVIQEMPDLEKQDLDRLVAWINSGALHDWPTTLTFAHLVKHFDGWVGKARRYSAGTGSVKVESMFK